MRQMLFPIFLFFLTTAQAQRPSSPLINKFFSAQRFERYEGAARISRLQDLQDRDWQFVDSTLFGQDKNGVFSPAPTIDLAPYVNEDGYIVYWITETSPVFPGGEKALQRYVSDVVFPHKLNVEAGRRSQIYIRCTIDSDGQVSDVAEAVPHREWIPAEVVDLCLDAVRYMPPWTPGLFRGKPVRVNKLIVFPLGE